jgi:hypothetical protein
MLATSRRRRTNRVPFPRIRAGSIGDDSASALRTPVHDEEEMGGSSGRYPRETALGPALFAAHAFGGCERSSQMRFNSFFLSRKIKRIKYISQDYLGCWDLGVRTLTRWSVLDSMVSTVLRAHCM